MGETANAGKAVLVVGASGYVGRLAAPALVEAGYRVRLMTRRPDRMRVAQGAPVEVTRGDLLDPDSLPSALGDVHTALYFAHAMDASGDFRDEEARGARNFAAAAVASGVRHIVYLGALARESEGRSSVHIASRHEVGALLRASGVPTTEFRASAVIGAGSLPFEVVRALVDRLPVMVTPRWVGYPVQPIAASDLARYLLAAVRRPPQESAVHEIGGADVVTYREFMLAYAKERGLRRVMIPVPVVTPGLSGLWLNLITPAHARIGRRIVDSVRHGSVVARDDAPTVFGVRPMGLTQAIREALQDERNASNARPR